MTEEIRFHPIRFAVDEEPYCIWVTQPRRYNTEFINHYNPNYFATLRDLYDEGATQDNRHEVALAVRMAYAHALEALFSLLGAALQAPHFVPGWLLSYQVRQIESLVTKLQHGASIRSRHLRPLRSWIDASRLIHYGIEESAEKELVIQRFARLWSGLASEFTDIKREYNSIKHGFRAISSGMEYAIRVGGADRPPETDEEWAEWLPLGSSEFGSRFLYTERIRGARYQWQLRERQNNWHPTDMLFGMSLVSMSLNNIICFLKLHNKIEEVVSYKAMPAEEDYAAAWQERLKLRVTRVDISVGALTAVDVPRLTKEYILSYYPPDEEE